MAYEHPNHPLVRIYMTPKGLLRLKLPKKGAKWHGAFKTLDELVKAAQKETPAPFYLLYVDAEE